MRAIGYIRVSTDEQAEHGYSLQDQRDRVEHYCSLHGFQLLETVQDDFTGRLLTRPGIERIRSLAEGSAFDILICVKLDRLARMNHLRRQFEEFLIDHGVSVAFCEQSFEDTPAGRLQKGVMGEFAEYESELIRDRTIRGRIRKANEAKRLPVYARTYGYRQISKAQSAVLPEYHGRDGELIVVDAEASVVRRIFQMYATGTTISEIAEVLHAENVPTRCGGTWCPDSIRGMLNNETYAGRLYYGRLDVKKSSVLTTAGNVTRKRRVRPRSEWIEIPCPALIDEALFQICQQKLAYNQQYLRGRKSTRWLLHGAVFCKYCETFDGRPRACAGTVSKNPKNINRYYRCTSRKRLDIPDCRTSFNADKLEAQALEVLKRAATPARMAQIARAAALDARQGPGRQVAEVARITKAIATANAEESRIADLVLAGLSPSIIARKVDEIHTRKKTLVAELAQAKRKVSTLETPAQAAATGRKVAEWLSEELVLAEQDPEALQRLFRLFITIRIYRGEEPEIIVNYQPKASN